MSLMNYRTDRTPLEKGFLVADRCMHACILLTARAVLPALRERPPSPFDMGNMIDKILLGSKCLGTANSEFWVV